MLRLSDILHSDVICKADSSLTGKVENVYFDEFCGKIVYFDISRTDGRALLPFSAAASVSDAVVTDDVLALLSPGDADTTSLRPSPIGRKVYTGGGKRRGAVTDVLFSAKGKVSAIIADGISYSPSSFRAFGDVLLLKDAASVRRNPPKPGFPKAQTDYPVSILSAAAADGTEKNPDTEARPKSAAARDASSAAQSEPHIRPADKDEDRPVYISGAAGGIDVLFGEESFTPYRIIADYNFLLGRTLSDDLVSYTGETLARRGERVSVETVEKARRHGKLMDLTLSSR